MESILTSVKKLCGMTEEYTHFDEDIIMYVNDVFTTLARLGVGPTKGFHIVDKDDMWSDFIEEESLLYHKVKTYVKRKCQLQFDPPQSSAHLTALTNAIAEDEWRLVEIAESLAAESAE